LLDYGIRAVISTEIADIFKSNALKNGLLPITVGEATVKWLLDNPGAEVEHRSRRGAIDLAGRRRDELPPSRPSPAICLLHGIDELGYLAQQARRDRKL